MLNSAHYLPLSLLPLDHRTQGLFSILQPASVLHLTVPLPYCSCPSQLTRILSQPFLQMRDIPSQNKLLHIAHKIILLPILNIGRFLFLFVLWLELYFLYISIFKLCTGYVLHGERNGIDNKELNS